MPTEYVFTEPEVRHSLVTGDSYRRVEHDSDDDAARIRSMSRPNPISVHLDRVRRELTGGGIGRGPDQLNAGPRGHHKQREYEARRPEDDRSSPEAEDV